MEISETYGKIFPMEVESGNDYISLKGDQLNCAQLVEPAISVSEIVVTPDARRDTQAVPDRYSYRIPLVMVNDIYIDQASLSNFCLDYSGFIPTVMIEFVDVKNKMLSVTSMKDGSVIKVYIGGLGDECYYKPIRQDFIVTEIRKVGGGKQNQGDNIQYRISGKLNVPIGYRRESWSNFPCTSTQELFNLAVQTGLGFSTNFEKTTNDEMKWQNLPNTDYFDFMRDITSHACYSPNTFFTSFIDQYYVLNFIECHSLLSHGGEKTDIPAIIYNHSQQVDDSMDEKGNKVFKYQDDKKGKNSPNTRFNNSVQKLTYYYLSNNEFFNGWTNFIEEYVEISNGASSTNDGYRRNIGYNDYNAGEWGMNNVIFSIPPIDNLERDEETLKIKDLPDKADKNTYIPINLVHANQTIYQTEERKTPEPAKKEDKPGDKNDAKKTTETKKEAPKEGEKDNKKEGEESAAPEGEEKIAVASSVDDISGNESFSFYGNVDTTNMFKLYYFAKEQNDFQMNCLRRCGLKVKLQNYNPSITKFSRIWVDIYDKNSTSSVQISPLKFFSVNKDLRKARDEAHNANIINFDDEGVIKDRDIRNSMGDAKFNRGLSGWYVVTELKFIFDKHKMRINTLLVLNRIEKKPLFKREYDIARNAIAKYKEDNVIDKLINSNDDFGPNGTIAGEQNATTGTTPGEQAAVGASVTGGLTIEGVASGWKPGAVLTDDMITSGGGSDAYFKAMEIPDAIWNVMQGKSFKTDLAAAAKITRESLNYVTVLHKNFSGATQCGEIVCNKSVSSKFISIFKSLYSQSYKIEKILLVDNYNADDNASMADNNTSCLNIRYAVTSNPNSKSLSNHAYGKAIDINPKYNPYVMSDNKVVPTNGAEYAKEEYRKTGEYAIKSGDSLFNLFKSNGFNWGGNYANSKDYQHFDIK